MFVRLGRLLVAGGLVAACALPVTAAAPLHAGQRAPAFSVKALDNKPLTLERLRGKPVYLNFFATWCAPCRDEAPGLIKLSKQYAKRGLVIVGIDDQETKDKAQSFHDDFKIPYRIGLGDAKMIANYGVIALPVHVFIDRKGFVKTYRLGEMAYPDIESAIKSIL